MYFKYLKYIIKHKWYVFIECCKVGLVWRGIIHDMSKFLPSEFGPYARHFNGNHPPTRDLHKRNYCKPTDTGDPEFDAAWRLHIKRNKHHWQWWTVPNDGDGIKLIEIEEPYLQEMICDWIGAGKVLKTNGIQEWWEENKNNLQIHPTTKEEIDQLIILYENKKG